MSDVSTPIRLMLIGWLAVLLAAIAVVAARGVDELAPMIVVGAVAVANGVWVWKRQSRASLVTSLVLGLLLAVQQLGYSVASATADSMEADTLIIDVSALAGAVLIAGGAVAAIIAHRRNTAHAATSPA